MAITMGLLNIIHLGKWQIKINFLECRPISKVTQDKSQHIINNITKDFNNHRYQLLEGSSNNLVTSHSHLVYLTQITIKVVLVDFSRHSNQCPLGATSLIYQSNLLALFSKMDWLILQTLVNKKLQILKYLLVVNSSNMVFLHFRMALPLIAIASKNQMLSMDYANSEYISFK